MRWPRSWPTSPEAPAVVLTNEWPSTFFEMVELARQLSAYVEGRYLDVLAANPLAAAVSPREAHRREARNLTIAIYHAAPGTEHSDKLALLTSSVMPPAVTTADLG